MNIYYRNTDSPSGRLGSGPETRHLIGWKEIHLDWLPGGGNAGELRNQPLTARRDVTPPAGWSAAREMGSDY